MTVETTHAQTATSNIAPKVETLATYLREEVWRSDAARSLDHPILFWVTRGQGRFMVDCRMRGIGPSTAIYIPANTLFSYDMFSQPQGMVVSLPNDDLAGFPQEAALLKTLSVQSQGELNGLIDALARELSDTAPSLSDNCKSRALQANVMLLSVWLDRLLAQQPAQEPGKSQRVLSKFSRVVSIGHCDGKNLAQYAADLKITPTHLTRLTQNALGKPASALVQERVINAACDRLVHSDQPVKNIAQRLGFTSPAYFTRAFQQHTGKSPSEFRRSRRYN